MSKSNKLELIAEISLAGKKVQSLIDDMTQIVELKNTNIAGYAEDISNLTRKKDSFIEEVNAKVEEIERAYERASSQLDSLLKQRDTKNTILTDEGESK